MDKLRNEANKLIQKIATPMMGVLKDSKFLIEGVLTPEEFILAGDQLSHKCPTWRYVSRNDNCIVGSRANLS